MQFFYFLRRKDRKGGILMYKWSDWFYSSHPPSPYALAKKAMTGNKGRTEGGKLQIEVL